MFALNMWRHYLYGMKCVVFINYKSLQHILDQKELNMRQRRWLKLLSDYDCKIRYHLGKANVMSHALSRKERIKPLRVQALVMTIGLNLPMQILNAQVEERKGENFKTEDLCGMVKKLKPCSDRTLCLKTRDSSVEMRKYYYGLRNQATKDGKQLNGEIDETILKGSSLDAWSASLDHLQPRWQIHITLLAITSESPRHLPLLTGPEIVHETIEKIIQIKSRIQVARDRQKSYTDVRRKPLEFQVGDEVMLKVSPWKGVISFDKQRKLNPRYIGPSKIFAKVRTIAYRLELPEQLSRVHSTFHMSNMKKCLSDESLVIPLDEIHIDDKLHFIEGPIEIMDREVKCLKQSYSYR
ncbi:putative reverse transcriptase domain-containing protein [Tanacetum coccineum]